MLREGSLGVISWEFRFRCAMGQRSEQGYNSLSLLHIHLKIFKHSQHPLCSHYPLLHKALFCSCFFSLLSLGLELSWKQQPAAPTLPLITTTSLGGRRVLMQQKSTSLLVSYSKAKKGGVCSAEQNSQALQGGQKKMWIFWILVWTKWNRMGIGIFSEEKFNFSNAEEKKNHNALHLFSNTAPLETKGTGRRG